MNNFSESTTEQNNLTQIVNQYSRLKILLRVCLWLFILGGSLFSWIVYNPDILKPLIQTGLPLNTMSGLPILGDAILAAEAPQISVQELKRLIDSKATNFVLVDVRSPEEYDYAHIPGAVLVPLTEIEGGTGITKLKALLPEHQLITYCSTGKRSNKYLGLLRHQGIKGTNVTGGIRAWKLEIDPSMPDS